jgi:hypothetical protein
MREKLKEIEEQIVAVTNKEILDESDILALKELRDTRDVILSEHDCHCSSEDGCDCSELSGY